MSRQLEQPAFPVSDYFLRIMSQLETLRTRLRALRPTFFPLTFLPSERSGNWRLLRFPETGRGTCVDRRTLLSDPPDGGTAELKAQVAAIVANNFTSLPIDRQMSELEDNWDELSRQPMLPVLQALMHRPPSMASSPFYSAADLNAAILRRWFGLDPEGAVREVTAQLASPNAALSAHSVGLLPGGPQAQF